MCATGSSSIARALEPEQGERVTAMDIKRSGSRSSSDGPPEWFTGQVRIESLFRASAPGRVQGASVTFEPGARSAWQTDPLGRTRRRDSSRGCGLLSARREALARRHAKQRDDAHRHPGGTRRQGGQLDGEGQRRAVQASSGCEGGRRHMTGIEGWENFYVIVGSSAGALIGLQFVVITLIASRPIGQVEAQAGSAFTTPSVVHFGLVLLLLAIVIAPWDEITVVAVLWGLLGLGGVAYVVIAARRMRKQSAYRPVFEDCC